MNGKMRVFWISLVLSTLSILTDWGSRIGHKYLVLVGVQRTYDYTFLFDLLGIILLLVTIFIGYRIGRNTDYKTEYNHFIKFIGIGWIVSSLVCIPIYYIGDDNFAKIDVIHFVFYIGLNVCAILFSSITLGWITRDGISFKRELNPVILRPVLLYNGFLLLRILLRRAILHIILDVSDPGAFLWQNSVLRYSVLPIWLWYQFRMLSSGKKIDLQEEYGSVLYTFWVPAVAYVTIYEIFNIVYYYSQYQTLSLLGNIPFSFIQRLIWSTLGILGLPFGLLCYGYIHSKYRYNAQLSERTDSSLNEA